MAKYIKVGGKDVHITGWRPDKPDHRDRFFEVVHNMALPPSVDLRPLCASIQDQGQLGSCTANAATSAMEFIEKRATADVKMYSRLFLYYTERVKLEGTDPHEDSGAQIRDTIKALGYFGSCYETTWPYDVTKFAWSPPKPAWDEAHNHKITGYYRVPSLTGIKQALTSGLPVVGGFSVPANMESDECAQSGIVRYPTPDEEIVGGHAILFVGYDNHNQWIIFQNSWGTGWGAGGFGFLPYKFFTTGLASDFWVIKTEQP
jgi:C1A family cysteine protease